MITLQDLDTAIKACEGQQNPSANTALKLAAYYTIKNELYPTGQPDTRGYSYALPVTETIGYSSDTDFGQAVNGKDTTQVMAVIDDLMSVLQSAQPRLHRRIVDKIVSS